AAPGNTRWPRVFALRPLSSELVSRRGVLLRTLRADGTLSTEETATDFQGVDLEVWARRLLADLDLFLTASYATGAYQSPGARAALATVLDAKATLARAIPRGLAPVL